MPATPPVPPTLNDDNSAPPLGSQVSPRGDVSLGRSGQALPGSAAARGLQFQIGRVDKLKAQLAALEHLGLAFVPLFSNTLRPLQARRHQAMQRVVMALADRLQRAGLSATQRQTGQAQVCAMALELVKAGVEGMEALYDRFSPVTLAVQREQEAQWVRRMVEERVGAPTAEAPETTSANDWLRWGAQQQQAARQAKQAKREAKRQARKKGATALQAEQVQQDASVLLKTLFRQLARSLHPDRETDPAKRDLKTALMSEANTAYARQDVLALLHLQSAALLTNQQASADNEIQLSAMTALVKQQVATLERERADKQSNLMHQLELPQGHPVQTQALEALLRQRQADLTQACEQLEDLPAQWQDDAALRRWLKATQDITAYSG